MSQAKFGEPWQSHIGATVENSNGEIIFDAEKPEHAERVVACVNFCAGIEVEALALLNQSGHPTLSQICEENQKLRRELQENASQ